MSWFGECRYGMFVHANIATVPAFAPVHEYADWYWAFLESKPDMVLHPTCPLPEVVAWHREHHGARPFDDFIPDLTFERFDADWYAQLLDDAGMRYLVHVTKHHDGYCWWDTALTDRKTRRDVVGELADAVRRRRHVFGCYYSLLDWAHPAYPAPDGYVDAFMRPQIRELVERYEPAVLWGDGHWGHNGAHWRADEIVDSARAYADGHGFELVVNDRFFASRPDFVVYEYDVPAHAPDRPWELCRGLSHSFCVNRAERAEDYLTGRQIVALLVETVAKGGNLLLNVGPNADGTLEERQEQLLRRSGEWIRAHADAIHGSSAFAIPGEGAHWYTRTGELVHAFDLSSAAEPRFAELHAVTSVRTAAGEELAFHEDDRGVLVDARAVDRHRYGTRYLVSCGVRPPIRLSAAAAPEVTGDVLELPPGRYGAMTVPAGAIVRGAGPARTIIEGGVQLGAGAAVENLTVTGGAPGYMMIPPTCVTGTGDAIRISDCVVESILLSGGDGHVVERNVIAGGKVWCMGANHVTVRGNYQYGLRWGAGIELNGGRGHVVEHNECRDDLCAIKCTSTSDVEIARNRYETRWFGIHLLEAERTLAYRNHATHTMRAVNVEGGRGNRVEKQLAEQCDSGVMIEGGAAETTVAECWLHDCRIGIFVWGAGEVELVGNAISEPREHEIVEGAP